MEYLEFIFKQISSQIFVIGKKKKASCVAHLPHMDEILIGAADDVVIGDGDGVDAAAAGLQDVDALQRPDVPNLKHRERERVKKKSQRASGRDGGREGRRERERGKVGGRGGIPWEGTPEQQRWKK